MATKTADLSITEIVAQLRSLGVVEGDVLLVHSSFRAVRPIEQGPAGLIQALCRSVGFSGAVVMPSWTGHDDEPFDPASTPAAKDLGAVADTFWRLPGTLRSEHPFAFAAFGSKSAAIVADDFVLPPHQPASPVGRVLEADGKILLLGVDHDASTTLHLAECLSGVPYGVPRHITVMRNQQPVRLDYLENDHCCELFRKVGNWLLDAGLQREGPVGHGTGKLMRAQDVVSLACAQLRKDPFTFLHAPEYGCPDCLEAWRSVDRVTDGRSR